MTTIQPPSLPTFEPTQAVAEMGKKHEHGKVIGYILKTSRTRNPALLVCLSSGGKRDPKSVKPNDQLWGFVYLHCPGKEPKFVRNTAVESITMALGMGTEVCLWDSIEELFGREQDEIDIEP